MKTALVTGASRGIGSEIARALAKEGYKVGVNYNKSEKEALKLCKEIEGIPLKADVSDESEVRAMFSALKDAAEEDISVLVNNAGVSRIGLLQDMDIEDYNAVMDVNLKGTFLCCKYAIPAMVRNKFGRIINISSVWGIKGASCEVVYSASKAGVIGLTKALAAELAPSGITVNAIAPGVCKTDMMSVFSESEQEEIRKEIPLMRFCEKEEIARAVLYLISASSQTGSVMDISGGAAL